MVSPQLKESDGNYKAVQGNTGHSSAGTLMNIYAHTQDKSRVKLAEKLEADFYREPTASSNASPDHPEIKKPNGVPESWPITGNMILEAIRLADADTKRELTRVLFA